MMASMVIFILIFWVTIVAAVFYPPVYTAIGRWMHARPRPLIYVGQRPQASSSPRWIEGRLTPQEAEAFSPISQAVQLGEARAVEEFYGEKPKILEVSPNMTVKEYTERWVATYAAKPNEKPKPPAPLPGTHPVAVIADPGRVEEYEARKSFSTELPPWIRPRPQPAHTYKYEQYVPGLGIVRADTPGKLARAIEVASAKHSEELRKQFDSDAAELKVLDAMLAGRNRVGDITTERTLALREKRAKIWSRLKSLVEELDGQKTLALYEEAMKDSEYRIRMSQAIPRMSIADTPDTIHTLNEIRKANEISVLPSDWIYVPLASTPETTRVQRLPSSNLCTGCNTRHPYWGAVCKPCGIALGFDPDMRPNQPQP